MVAARARFTQGLRCWSGTVEHTRTPYCHLLSRTCLHRGTWHPQLVGLPTRLSASTTQHRQGNDERRLWDAPVSFVDRNVSGFPPASRSWCGPVSGPTSREWSEPCPLSEQHCFLWRFWGVPVLTALVYRETDFRGYALPTCSPRFERVKHEPGYTGQLPVVHCSRPSRTSASRFRKTETTSTRASDILRRKNCCPNKRAWLPPLGRRRVTASFQTLHDHR